MPDVKCYSQRSLHCEGWACQAPQPETLGVRGGTAYAGWMRRQDRKVGKIQMATEREQGGEYVATVAYVPCLSGKSPTCRR